MNGFIEDQEYRLVDFKGLESRNKLVANLVKDVGGSIIVHDVNAFGSVLLWSGVTGIEFKTLIILSSYAKFFEPIDGVCATDALIPSKFWDSSGIKLNSFVMPRPIYPPTYPAVFAA